MTERIIRTPVETDALCIGLLAAARMLREHAISLHEAGEAPQLSDLTFLAGLLEQQAAEMKDKARVPA